MSVYGPLISRGVVAEAVRQTLMTPPSDSAYALLVYFLAEFERQHGLRPKTLPIPDPTSYRVGIDQDTWREDMFPVVIVDTIPDGPPQPLVDYEYAQNFTVTVGATVEGQDEIEALRIADAYGIAIAAAVMQHTGLGGVATSTMLASSPTVEFPRPERRSIVRSIVTFTVLVSQTLLGDAGPISFPSDPYVEAADWPSVETVDITFTAEPDNS